MPISSSFFIIKIIKYLFSQKFSQENYNQAIYELEQYEWERENSVLNTALDIFTSASRVKNQMTYLLLRKKVS